MKTREDIYGKEATALLRIITTYHALTYEQVIRSFHRKPETIRNLISNLIKQGRIYYDSEKELLCDSPEAADAPDYGLIAAYWVLLDFDKSLFYHITGDFPVTITCFCNDEEYEIIYVQPGQEVLFNHVLAKAKETSNRILVLETVEQAHQLQIPHVVAFCTVDTAGTVSYYKKGR